MRICLFTPTFLPKVGGTEVVTDALARRFTELGHHAVVLAKGAPTKLDVPYPVRWFRNPRAMRLRPTAMGPAIAELHRRERFDVWCVNYGYPTGYGAIRASQKLGGPPVVVVSHGGDLYRSTKNRTIPAIWKPTVYAYRHAHALVAISPYIEQLIRELDADLPPIERIPNGIDAALFDRDPPRPVDFADERPFCLCLGNLRPSKGFDDAIAAFAASRERLDGLAMVIVGAGPCEGELRRQAAQLEVSDDVIFVGRRLGDEKLWFLREARFGLMPSIEEGHPITALEYLAAGTPLICSRNAAFDGMHTDGDNAIRVAVGDRSALAEAMCQMHGADLAAMATRSRDVVQRYDWAIIAERYLACFERVAHNAQAVASRDTPPDLGHAHGTP